MSEKNWNGRFVPAAVLLSSAIGWSAGGQITLQSVASYDHTDPEINAFNPAVQRTFVTKAGSSELDVLNAGFTLDLSINVAVDEPDISEINSVATRGNLVAVAGKALVGTNPGVIAFYDATTLSFLGSVTAGANPDMVTFTADGSKVLVANEGEPSDDYLTDPEGSISIIDVSGGVGAATVSTADFGSVAAPASGARFFGPGASLAQDAEPEYIALSPDGATAYVSLQENNAIAVVDVASASVTNVYGLGFKDHSLPGNGFDASNEDGIDGNIQTHPTLGMYQPDAIATYGVGGVTYLVSANEGDARDYDGFSEETRIVELALDLNDNGIDDDLDDDGLLNNSLAVYDDLAVLGRLKTTTSTGDTDGDGLIEEVYSYGARSFSIWNADTGALVFDSGDDFEQRLINDFPGEWAEGRSDDKGPEPESVVLGEVDGKTLAFIGLERTGGIMIYDITDPTAPEFESFASLSALGITSPEGLTFVDAADSPWGQDTLLVSNEFQIDGNTQSLAFVIVPEPGTAMIGGIATVLTISRRRRGR